MIGSQAIRHYCLEEAILEGGLGGFARHNSGFPIKCEFQINKG
jgi:hypothetical protein